MTNEQQPEGPQGMEQATQPAPADNPALSQLLAATGAEDTPEHRAALAEALTLHAEDQAEADPDRAQAALRAARAAQAGEDLPYTVGTWGGQPNYQCRWCAYAHLSERAAAIHGVSCPYRSQGEARPQRSVGGIT